MIKKILVAVFFIAGLIYLVLPGPNSINDIPPIPQSLKSSEPGDTTQSANIAAYFSNYRRNQVTDFYKSAFGQIHPFNIAPIRFNHPPEESFVYIRDQQPTTYLEEYSYPLRSSLFVNGFEPFDQNGKPYRRGATSIVINNTFYETKTTLRFYNSFIPSRILVYCGIFLSSYLLFLLFKKFLKEKIA